MADALVDIIIPVYGALSYLKRCLRALRGNTQIPYHLILIDDYSPPASGALEYLVSLRSHASVYFNRGNLGFGETCNRGVARGSAPFICLLNSDTEPQEDWLPAMLANMADMLVGMVGAKLIFPPIEQQTNHTHIPGRIQHAGVYFDTDKYPREAFQNYKPDHPLVNRRIEVSAVTHACVLIRRSEWGEGYDTRYEAGAFEDVDLCLQFRARGLKIIYEPEAILWHWQGASYDHHQSDRNLALLMEKWRDAIEPDPDIFTPDSRPLIPRGPEWWRTEEVI